MMFLLRREAAAGIVAISSIMIGACNTNDQAPSPAAPPISAVTQNTLQTRTPALKRKSRRMRSNALTYASPIQHVVVIVQENRSLNDLFNGYIGRDGSVYTTTKSPLGGSLASLGLESDKDPKHGYLCGYYYEAQGTWQLPPPCPAGIDDLSYVNPGDSNVAIYWDLAHKWALAGNVMQTNGGPSFIAHQFLIAGQSGAYPIGGISGGFENVENPVPAPSALPASGITETGGCDVTSYSDYTLNPYFQLFPTNYYNNTGNPMGSTCQDYPTVFDLMQTASGQSYSCSRPPPPDSADPIWAYYTPQQQLIWSAPIGVSHLFSTISRCVTGFTVDPGGQKLYNDVVNKQRLAPVTYIVPCATWSDHAPYNKGGPTGPQWVEYIANLIGESQFWPTTTIIVIWDDWGGWYDPVPGAGGIHLPSVYNTQNIQGYEDTYQYGFRVPMLVISPYIVRANHVDNTGPSISQTNQVRTQASILAYIEYTFNLPSLGTADSESDNMVESINGSPVMFNFNQQPLPYTPETMGPTNPFPLSSCASMSGDTDNT